MSGFLYLVSGVNWVDYGGFGGNGDMLVLWLWGYGAP